MPAALHKKWVYRRNKALEEHNRIVRKIAKSKLKSAERNDIKLRSLETSWWDESLEKCTAAVDEILAP